MTIATRRIKIHCPNCRRKLAAPKHAAGKRGRCPHCSTTMIVPASRQRTSAREDDVARTPAPPRPSRRQAGREPRAEELPNSEQTPRQADVTRHASTHQPAPEDEPSRSSTSVAQASPSGKTQAGSITGPFVNALSRAEELVRRVRLGDRQGTWIVAGVVTLSLCALIVLVKTVSANDITHLVNDTVTMLVTVFCIALMLLPLAATVPLYLTARHRVRRFRDIVFYVIWAGPLIELAWCCVLEFVLASAPEALLGGVFVGITMGVPWMLIMRWPAHWIARHVCAAVYRRIPCPDCHEKIEARGRWDCGCGYKDHRDRNIFLFRCPNCSSRVDYTACPCCDATILM